MFPQSIAVLAAAAAVLAVAGGLLIAAFRLRHFEGLDQQAMSLFEDRDLQLARPWEDPEQRRQRVAAYGMAVAPGPGEWGGAT